MDKKLIMPTEISIKEKKNLVTGTIARAAIYASTNVIEMITTDDDMYYLIFYKNSLIYGEKLDKAEDGSFINKAFQKGIVIESPHPLIKKLIPSQSVTIPNKNKLFSQLQLHYSLQELCFIATTLDSFFDKETLVNLIDKVYFHYRRNGNFLKSFRVLQTLNHFSPSLKSANERLNSREYHSYDDFYKTSSMSSILKKDPLYVELHCFENRINHEKRKVLKDIFNNENRFAEILMLWLESPENEPIESVSELALKFITLEEWILILSDAQINPFRELPGAKVLIEKMVQEGNSETAARYILSFIHDLPQSYEPILDRLWENLNAGFVASRLDDFLFMFQQLIHKGNFKEFDQKTLQLVVLLLEEYDLKTVYEKLLPIQKLFPDSDVMGRVKRMMELAEDPDRMMELGDYFADFKQFDKAIDCYCWEMELNPQDPIPVLKISKMYQQKGMVKEASAYQKVHNQLKNGA